MTTSSSIVYLVKNILTNVTITPNVTKGRSVQDTKEILSYMLVASLATQQQQLNLSTKTTTAKTITNSQAMSKVNNYYYYDYSEDSNPLIVPVSQI
jgi:hypothetical protein